jgi:hypothetical protein
MEQPRKEPRTPPSVSLQDLLANDAIAFRRVWLWAQRYGRSLYGRKTLTELQLQELATQVTKALTKRLRRGSIADDEQLVAELIHLARSPLSITTKEEERLSWALERADEWIEHPEIGVRTSRDEYTTSDLSNSSVRSEVALTSPSLELILALQRGTTDFYDIGWRAFEELVAELLHAHGWDVQLQAGRNDGGADVIARKLDPQIGPLLTIWQAKKLSMGKKVGISTIRELADTRSQFGASKGIVVTSSYLTRGALNRVVRDCYMLGKIDRDDLWAWIRAYRGH